MSVVIRRLPGRIVMVLTILLALLVVSGGAWYVEPVVLIEAVRAQEGNPLADEWVEEARVVRPPVRGPAFRLSAAAAWGDDGTVGMELLGKPPAKAVGRGGKAQAPDDLAEPRGSTGVAGLPVPGDPENVEQLPSRSPFVARRMQGSALAVHLERGWQAWRRGDYERARMAYTQALEIDPRQRDALLGMATIEADLGNPGQAEVLVRRVLSGDPRDVDARAALAAIAASEGLADETLLRTLVRDETASGNTPFLLGNLYASQGRWPDASQAWREAVVRSPDNADYTFNLAVSLEHLGERRVALEHYLRAVELAARHPVGFSVAHAEARIAALTMGVPAYGR